MEKMILVIPQSEVDGNGKHVPHTAHKTVLGALNKATELMGGVKRLDPHSLEQLRGILDGKIEFNKRQVLQGSSRQMVLIVEAEICE